MGVYVVAGKVEGYKLPADKAGAITAAGVAAIKAVVDKTAGLQSTPNAKSQDGVELGLMVSGLTITDKSAECTVVGKLFKLPKRELIPLQGRTLGKGKGDTIEACMLAAVDKLMEAILPQLVGSTVTPTATGKPGGQIYIGPFDVIYGAGAPQGIKDKVVLKVKALAAAKVAANKRFDTGSYTTGSGIPAYTLAITVNSIDVTNAAARNMEAKCSTQINDYVSKAMVNLGAPATTKWSGGKIDDAAKIQIATDAAEQSIDKSLAYILKLNP